MSQSKKLAQFFGVIAIMLGLSTFAAANDAVQFTRFVPGKTATSGQLQIAQATYRNPKTGVEIVLYGVVHIADKTYFQAIQKDLDAYDVVLWEGVKPGKNAPKTNNMSGIGGMQKMMCDLLGLTFQKDGIDYKRDHFVWADMDMDQFQKSLGQGSEGGQPGMPGMFNNDMMKNMGPMMKMGAQFAKNLFKSNPAMREQMKFRFAQQLANAGVGDNIPGMSPEMKRVILDERNAVVMKVLEQQLVKRQDGSIAIFYGAAHMPDFHERLAKLGFNQVSKSWKTAWNIGAPTEAQPTIPGETDEAPKAAPKSKRRWF